MQFSLKAAINFSSASFSHTHIHSVDIWWFSAWFRLFFSFLFFFGNSLFLSRIGWFCSSTMSVDMVIGYWNTVEKWLAECLNIARLQVSGVKYEIQLFTATFAPELIVLWAKFSTLKKSLSLFRSIESRSFNRRWLNDDSVVCVRNSSIYHGIIERVRTMRCARLRSALVHGMERIVHRCE